MASIKYAKKKIGVIRNGILTSGSGNLIKRIIKYDKKYINGINNRLKNISALKKDKQNQMNVELHCKQTFCRLQRG
jgi:hypothetical protein